MKRILIAVLSLGMAVVSICGSASAEDLSQADKKRLFREGAKLWPVYCSSCHNARPGSEKAPYEWDQIMMHMRTVGNLPPQDAQAILEYLKSR